MTTFDIDEEKSAWFDMEGGGRVKLRVLSTSDWERIREKTVTKEPIVMRVDDGSHKLFEREIVDDVLQRKLVNDETIVEWENIVDKDNNEIECTIENKDKLMMMRNPFFRNFVNEKLDTLTELYTEEEKEEEKN